MTEDRRSTSRRDLLRALGVGAGAVALGGPTLLTACADDSSTSGASTGAAGGSGSTTASGGGTSSTPSTTVAPTPFDPSRPYWVQGNFRGVATEETATDLEVVGAIPSELS